MLTGSALLLATAVAAKAQLPYQTYPLPANGYYPTVPGAAAVPPSWNYDPYTTIVPCPQWSPYGTTPCPPSYGSQPVYGTWRR
jgi:hypothetical protein